MPITSAFHIYVNIKACGIRTGVPMNETFDSRLISLAFLSPDGQKSGGRAVRARCRSPVEGRRAKNAITNLAQYKKSTRKRGSKRKSAKLKQRKRGTLPQPLHKTAGAVHRMIKSEVDHYCGSFGERGREDSASGTAGRGEARGRVARR